MSVPFTSQLRLLAISTYICLTVSYQISQIEKLQKRTCEAVYTRALENRTEIDFSKAVGNLSCSPGPNRLVKYQCMINEDGHNIQFCGEWIWIEAGLCPRLYSLQGIINPSECHVEGCPTDKYQSHEYYKFPVCFEQKDIDNKEGSKETQKGNSFGVNLGLAVALPICLAAVVIVIIIIIAVFIWKRRKEGTKYTTNSQQQILLTRTRPLVEADRCLQKGKCIFLTGKKGEGVSTFIKMIRETYFHDHEWQKTDYGFHDINYSDKLYLVIGERSFSDEREWEGLKNLINMNERQTKIVIDVPRSLYDNCKERLHAECGDVEVGIDLSSDKWKMNEDERTELIDKMMREKKIGDTHLTESKKSQIVNYESDQYGFCHVCNRLFNGTRRQVIAKLKDVKTALKEIEEGNPSNAKTKSDTVNKLEMEPLL